MVVEIDDLKRRFAQFGKGEGTSSTLVVTNPSATQKVTGKVKLFDQLGNPLTVSVNGTAQSGEFPFDVPGQVVAFFATDGAGEPAVTGWAEVEADAPFGGTILFSGSAGVAGVGAAHPSVRFLVPIESDADSGVRTGVALANPTTDSVDLTLRLRDSNADPAGNGNLVINLGPRSQLARFPEELFAGTGADLTQFRGSLEVESLRPVIGMAIRLGPGQFATLPVAPMGFGQSRLHFAHFGDGSGVSSTLILVNSFADRTASGTVFLFDSQGDPLSVNINGVLRVGQFSFALPAWGATQPSASFLMPIESDTGLEVRTGVALSNPNPGPVDVTLILRDAGTDPVETSTVVIVLAGRGQLARFPEELFAGKGVDFSRFRGTLEVRSVVPLNGMAIRVSPGEFATLPVTPTL